VEARIIQLNQFLVWFRSAPDALVRGHGRSWSAISAGCITTASATAGARIKTQQHRLVTVRAFFKHLVRQTFS